VNKHCKAVIGNGVVVNVPELLKEAYTNEKKGQVHFECVVKSGFPRGIESI